MGEHICKEYNQYGVNIKNIYGSDNSISKTRNLVKIWQKTLNRLFSKKGIQIAKRHMKRCLTVLIIREMPIKEKKEKEVAHSCNPI